MSEMQSPTPDSESDHELRQALTAAFGDDAIRLLDEDDGDATSARMVAPVGGDKCVNSSDTLFRDIVEDRVVARVDDDNDVSPLIHYVKELNKAIYAERLTTRPDAGQLPTNEQHTAARTPRFMVFAVGEHQFGVPLNGVREIAQYPKVTGLPHTPRWLRGVANLRGHIVSITDLRYLLDLSGERPAHGEHIVVVHSNKPAASTAIVADRVLGIRDVGTQHEGISDLSHRIETIAMGTATIDQGKIVLIDLDRLFTCAALLAPAL